jgi:hypothetical protein
MCVLICANPGVSDWVIKVTARSQRTAHLFTPICVAPYSTSGDDDDGDRFVLDEVAVARIARGATLRECEWPSSDAASLARESKNAFELLTEAWGRLLSLVGLRR